MAFRKTGEKNTPATWVKVPKQFGPILSAEKVLVADPTCLVFYTVKWLSEAHVERLESLRNAGHAHENLNTQNQVAKADDAFYHDPLWDDLSILSHLFQLLRPYDARVRPPLWTQAPFREREWDFTIDALEGMNEEKKRELLVWIQRTMFDLQRWSLVKARARNGGGEGKMQKQALEYFWPFFQEYSGKFRVGFSSTDFSILLLHCR